MAEWDKTIHESRHTLYPVCEDSPDNVVGILNAKDYFRLNDKRRESVMKIVKPAFFVPETIKADVLFRKMKKTRNNLAVVLDEYGGLAGVISLEDVIEEMLGQEIVDESDVAADLREVARKRRAKAAGLVRETQQKNTEKA